MSWDKITEKKNPASVEIDKKSTWDILHIINAEDTRVASAVKESLPYIEGFIDALITRLNKGGRLFYIGSGTSGRLGILDAAECPPTFRTDPEMIQGIIAGGNEALVCSIEGAEDNPDDGAQAIIDYGVTTKDVVLGITTSSS
ncbi:uncharacterized protein METZ01_LOCUS473002, partial [marine metagenome]